MSMVKNIIYIFIPAVAATGYVLNNPVHDYPTPEWLMDFGFIIMLSALSCLLVKNVLPKKRNSVSDRKDALQGTDGEPEMEFLEHERFWTGMK